MTEGIEKNSLGYLKPLPRLLTKVIPPRFRRNMLRRERLINLLNEYSDISLFIIAAPAGYGKTCLLADFASRASKPCCWVSFDEEDLDPCVFIENVVHALERIYPAIALNGQLSSRLREALQTKDYGVEICVRLLVNQICNVIHDDFDLIFDDFQIIEEQPIINEFVSLLVSYLPGNCRLILSCRNAPSLDITNLILTQKAVGIGPAELKLTAEEVYELLNGNYNLNLTQQAASELVAKTEGWFAGVLLSNSLAPQFNNNLWGFSNREQLFNYLIVQIFQHLPKELQNFLLESSVLEEFNSCLISRLLGIENENSLDLLGECERQMLFISRVENIENENEESNDVDSAGSPNPCYYRYHGLFRDFLQQQLRQTNPERFRALNLLCAELFKEQGDHSKLMYHLAQAAAYPEMVLNLLEWGETEIKVGHSQTVQKWLAHLQEEHYVKYPELALLKVQILGQQRAFPEAYTLLENFRLLLPTTNQNSLKIAQTYLLQGKLLRSENRYMAAVTALQRGLGLLETCPATTDELKAEIQHELGVCLGMNGEFSQALKALEQAKLLWEKFGNTEKLAHTHHCLSLIYEGNGERNRQHINLQKSLYYWYKVGKTPGLVNAMLHLAVWQLAEANFELADETLKQATELAEQIGYQAGQAYILAFRGDLCRDTNRFAEAYAFYLRAIGLAEQHNEKRLTISLYSEILAVLRVMDDYDEAAEVLRQAHQALEPLPQTGNFLREIIRLAEIGIELDKSNLSQASLLLASGSNFEENKQQLTHRQFLHARLLFAERKPQEAIKLLQSVVKNCTGQLNLGQLRLEALRALPFLYTIKENRLLNEPERKFIEDLLVSFPENLLKTAELPKNLPTISSAAPAAPAPANYPLVVSGFGVPEVLVNGAAVRKWRSVKACELLFLLLTHNKPLTKEFIAEALFPDTDFSQLAAYCKTAVYRLRNALEADWIKFADGGYSLNVPFWYDVHNFEKLVAAGDKLYFSGKSADKPQALQNYQAANALYRADFLENFYSDWALTSKNELERLHVETLLKQTLLELELNLPEFALETVERCLARDKCNEAAHLQKLRIYKHLNNPYLQTQAFQDYCQKLEEELHLAPSEEIRQFYENAIAISN